MSDPQQWHYGKEKIADWANVRKTTNYQSNGPVTDVTSSQMTCYQLAPGNEGATTVDIQAGSSVAYNVKTSITHPGSFSAWLAKVPAGETAATYDGSGANWFKIYQDHPTFSASGPTWPSQGLTAVNIPIPSCVENGEYLLRAEHIALHSASSVGGAQFYLSCAQVSISGGSGTAQPELVSIPGVYKATDPGILINIYYPVLTNYTAPGPAALQC
ncbi:family 61 glycoside hydrolase [Cryphonectria parasitica EP155]|uniref:lytic cellulose monooxygenase (C4-dehydrogenating) n=1 Tax=Cryphonectria parasitica (strain ATCC 38755 / EP155) TaxID=660469 RepID=A0A9P5CNY7_CRYP1|nr:family 61 glycoside hydrolase [Cryphonectria parasitica EP155]KAF3764435.1 family 61 glycoside hydrolase [Cryphonectria parasitica EP155]